MASEMEFSQHNKVKRRSPWHGPMVLVLLFFVVILVMSLAFRVSKIEVINASEYTDEEIIRASGVERGANLFFVDRFKAASMIFSDLPYMDTVSITRQLPNKIVIQAEGSAPAAYMVIDEEYWLLDRSGKMLGTTDSLTAGEYPEIRSLEPMTVLEGEDMLVEGTNAERLAVLQTILPALRAEDVSSLVEWIDLRDPANPSLRYDGRLTVYLGAEGEMLYRIAMLKNVVSQLTADDVLIKAVSSISELIKNTGFINLDFADVTAVMKGAGLAHMGVGRAAGKNKAEDAAKMAVSSPLMETSIDGARGVLINSTGSKEMGLDDVEAAAMLVQGAAHPEANIIFGASFDDSLDDEIVVTVIATGFDEKKPETVKIEEPRDANLFTDARERAESQKEPAAVPAPEEDGEDPFDTIFKIFNK